MRSGLHQVSRRTWQNFLRFADFLDAVLIKIILIYTLRVHGCLKRLFIDFLTKMSYFNEHNIGNPVQIIKYVELSILQHILKFKVTFVESLFTLKPFKLFIGNFHKIRFVTKWGLWVHLHARTIDSFTFRVISFRW